MQADEKLANELQLQKLRGLLAAGTTKPLSAQATTIEDHGVAPGRKVFDSVTGQTVTVISSAIVHIPNEAIPEEDINLD